jgi:hypothetical protein
VEVSRWISFLGVEGVEALENIGESRENDGKH